MPKFTLPIAALLIGPVTGALASTPETPKECVADADASFGQDGDKYTFTMTLRNECDRPVSCEVYAYVVGSRGPTQGHKVLKLPARGQTPTTASYVMRVNQSGGSAQYSRDCKFR